MNDKNHKGHIAMLGASMMWGLMAPVGKAALESGISALSLVTFRMIGAAVCFWIVSLFFKKEQVKPHDLLMLFFAALFGIVFNQGSFIFGLAMTSPINASIVTTTSPIVTMIVAAIYLKEPVTGKKVMGIFLGAMGALVLILSSQSSGGREGNITGDLLCLTAQISFSLYLTIFKALISRYHTITSMKWMFTYATICYVPFSYNEISSIDFLSLPWKTWSEVLYVILCGTFLAYILMITAQKKLRPTLVSMYNYVQPIVATGVSVWLGMGTFGWIKAIAVIFVFWGVYMVTQSKSKAQLEKEQK